MTESSTVLSGTLLRLRLEGMNPVLVMGILTCYPHMEHLTCSYYRRCVVTHGSECHLTFTLDILVGKLQGFDYDIEDNPRDPSPLTELLQTNGLIFQARGLTASVNSFMFKKLSAQGQF